jgi:hypothetical protein
VCLSHGPAVDQIDTNGWSAHDKARLKSYPKLAEKNE